MVTFRRVLILLTIASLALPGGALAQTSIAPPGNSGIDQYRETVPDAAGGEIPRRPGSHGGTVLSPGERRALNRLGRDGRALASVIEQTAPAQQFGPDRRAGRDRGPALPETAGDSPVRKAAGTTLGADDGDGLGVGLPLILGGTLGATLLLVFLRRRRQDQDAP